MPQITSKPTKTDWERVKREVAKDAPIPHAAADGPYVPNDAAGVAAYWQQASIKRRRETPTAEARELISERNGFPSWANR
mgnify:CR=1 FL=1|jgi:hypothetical protein